MKRKLKIEQIVKENFNLEHYKIEDVSESHRGHSGFVEGKETHFNLLIVSNDFLNLSKIERHRKINKLLKQEFENDLHAVSYNLLTKDEYI